MKKIRLIAMDVDGTVVPHDQEIPEVVREAIAEAAHQGVVITLATGRMYCSARPIAESLEVNAPLITYNGALVQDLLGHRYLEQPLPKEYVIDVATLAKELGVTLNLYVNDELTIERWNDDVAYYLSIAQVEPREVGDLVEFARSLTDEQSVHKALWVGEPDRLRELLPMVRRRYEDRIEIVPSQPRFIEFTDGGVSKGRALAALCRSLDIPREQVLAVGDNFNDVTMLEWAGVGVAMGNAPEAVKKVADYVVGTVAEGGVAQAIDRFVLKGRP